MNKEKILAFTKDLKELCKKHNLSIGGCCVDEGIYSEICFSDKPILSEETRGYPEDTLFRNPLNKKEYLFSAITQLDNKIKIED